MYNYVHSAICIALLIVVFYRKSRKEDINPEIFVLVLNFRISVLSVQSKCHSAGGEGKEGERNETPDNRRGRRVQKSFL